MSKKIKNQTKNIPKNFGKGIISFIEKNPSKVKILADKYKFNSNDFTKKLKELKRSINTIADLRNLWVDEQYAQSLRILSNLFLRKYSLHYIFNSRICNFGSHIKYRQSLWKAIEDPKSFNHIKYY